MIIIHMVEIQRYLMSSLFDCIWYFVGDIMDIICTSDISTLREGIIYAIGSVKFLALNSLLHDDLLNANCASCFAKLLKDVKALVSVAVVDYSICIPCLSYGI